MKKICICAIIGITTLLSTLAGLAGTAEPTGRDRQAEIAAVAFMLRNPQNPVDYRELSRSISLLGPESEELLVEVLRREEPVEVTEGSGLPGVMSPLDILKAMAMDALGRLGAWESMEEMRQVYKKASSTTLRRIARKNIEALGGSVE